VSSRWRCHREDPRIPAASVTLTFAFTLTRTGSLTTADLRQRDQGLRLGASEANWAHGGDGLVVRGSAEAIAMGLSGGAGALRGDGTDDLAACLDGPRGLNRALTWIFTAFPVGTGRSGDARLGLGQPCWDGGASALPFRQCQSDR